MTKPKSTTKAAKMAEDARLKEIYAWSRANFSAADLQKFTVVEKGVPAEKVLKQMKEIHKKHSKKRV